MASFKGLMASFPVGPDDRHTTAQVDLGTRVVESNGKEWIYVKAGATIAALDAVKFNGSADGYDDVRPTAAVNEYVLGVASAAFASAEYGFVQTRGVCDAKVVDSTAAGSSLSSSATAGTLKLSVETELAYNGHAVALETGADEGSAIYLG